MVCGEWQILAVTFEVSEYKAPSKPLTLTAADASQKYDQSRSSTDPDGVGFLSKQLLQHSTSRDGSILCADTSEVRTSYLRTPLEKSLVVHVEASAVSRPCTILPLRNGKVGVPHSGDRVETYAFDIKG